MATNPLSTLLQRFACARLSQSYLSKSCSDFPQRSPPWLLTAAACGGLRSTPDCRPRRALLHLSYSYASPCEPALVVTQDPSPPPTILPRNPPTHPAEQPQPRK